MCSSCRSRKTLQNEYLVVKIGVDTAENGPSKVDGSWVLHNIHSPREDLEELGRLRAVRASAPQALCFGYLLLFTCLWKVVHCQRILEVLQEN